MDVAVACMFPTLFSRPIKSSRNNVEEYQGAMFITNLVGDRRRELEEYRPSSGALVLLFILYAKANEFDYLKMGTRTDSS